VRRRLQRANAEGLEQATGIVRQTRSVDVAKVLIQLGMNGEREITQAKALEMGYAFVDLDRIQIAADAIAQLPAELAYEHILLPVKVQGNTLYLATLKPSDLKAIDAASVACGKRIIPVLATKEGIEQALQRYYPIAKTEGS
jgi:type IV pilus assembly protein PilB